MTGKLLDSINSPQDIKEMDDLQLNTLAAEIRDYLIDVISKTGGHLAPNLGVVELTLALHKVFNTPTDKIIWDVGHQAYIHKILTGRREAFTSLRQYKGLSGFPRRDESEHDAFGVGHSSTSISAALGFAVARDLQKQDYNVVAVIGDGSMTGGMAFEALNNAGSLNKKLIIVLNDNEMSISKNVGALADYLYQLRTARTYTRIKKDIKGWLQTKNYGDNIVNVIDRVKSSVKYLLIPGSVFEHLGFKYFGPIDGHDIPKIIEMLETAKEESGPVIIHVITKKGKGYQPAESEPNKFHGTGPFDIATGCKISNPKAPITYTEIFGHTITKLADDNQSIVAITAAMTEGTGLNYFAAKHPERFFDVGIAEQHAVTAAAGIAAAGMKPIVAVYSTFLQRAYDSVLHDICLQKLPVVLCLDRAGLVGDDGCTHHGVFDYSFLRSIPNMTVMAPKDENELQHMLLTAVSYNLPCSIRYPRGAGLGVELDKELHLLPIGKAEVINNGHEVCLWAIGSMYSVATKIAENLAHKGIDAGLVNMRFAKPLDIDLLKEHAQRYKYLVTLEEGILEGGVGSEVLEVLNAGGFMSSLRVLNIGIPDTFVQHGAKDLLLKEMSLDAASIEQKILNFMNVNGNISL